MGGLCFLFLLQLLGISRNASTVDELLVLAGGDRGGRRTVVVSRQSVRTRDVTNADLAHGRIGDTCTPAGRATDVGVGAAKHPTARRRVCYLYAVLVRMHRILLQAYVVHQRTPGREETSNCRFQTPGGQVGLQPIQTSLAACHHSSGYTHPFISFPILPKFHYAKKKDSLSHQNVGKCMEY
jgi:hypothetical protein